MTEGKGNGDVPVADEEDKGKSRSSRPFNVE